MDAITHDTGNQGWKLCKCSECGCEEVCTPNFDFYVRTEATGGRLTCERCIMSPFRESPIVIVPTNRQN